MLNAAYIYSRMIEWGSHGTNAGSFIISLLNRTNSYVKKPRKSLLDSLQATFLPPFRLTDYSWLTYAACSTCSLTYSELRFIRHSPESRSCQGNSRMPRSTMQRIEKNLRDVTARFQVIPISGTTSIDIETWTLNYIANVHELNVHNFDCILSLRLLSDISAPSRHTETTIILSKP